jgi:hypothetical protein
MNCRKFRFDLIRHMLPGIKPGSRSHNTLVIVCPLEDDRQTGSRSEQGRRDAEADVVHGCVCGRPEEGSVNRGEVAKAVDQRDGDRTLLPTVEHGDHPTEEDGSGRPNPCTTEADENIAVGSVSVSKRAQGEGHQRTATYRTVLFWTVAQTTNDITPRTDAPNVWTAFIRVISAEIPVTTDITNDTA